MGETRLTAEQGALLAELVSGIIPPDHRDAGAAAVSAGPRLAQRIESGVNAALYRKGLAVAAEAAQELFGPGAAELTPEQRHRLVGAVKARLPGFYKQLRLDVSALYLSDPGVWQRIGFPGPATEQGGYPDFDQPQG